VTNPSLSVGTEVKRRATGRILVVEDEKGIREGLRNLLEREGFEVVAAENGQEGLALFRDTNPDLVLTDVEMPLMNGFELCGAIKSNRDTRLIPVVLVTGLRDVTGIEAGADDFISKPFEPAELLARVRSLLRLKHYTGELESAEAVIKAVEGKDPYTEGHCECLSAYAVALGQRLGRPEEEIEALRKAGAVHDVGKICVPDAVLKKAGPLTNLLGGIRLAEHVVATAKNTGMNNGRSNFCGLYGSHQPFDQATLDGLYGSHDEDVDAVEAVVETNLANGHILPYPAERPVRDAEASSVGR